MAGKGQSCHKALSRRTRAFLAMDKKYVRGLAREVERHFNANDLRPSYLARKNLYCKPPSQVRVIPTTDDHLVPMDGQRPRWAGDFNQ